MDFTILAVVLLIGIGIPVRNPVSYTHLRAHETPVEIKHATKSGKIPS